MSWKAVLVVEMMRDDLAHRVKRLVDETCIHEKGLSLAQVHHLIVAMNRIGSLRRVEQYIREATGRSRPGEAWKKACPTRLGGGWQFFGERLQEEAKEIFADAMDKARRARVGEVRQQAAAMACLREFFGYFAWYFAACEKGFPLPATQTERG